MNQKKSEFDKVFSAWDILVIAFGAMIGWGWVVSTGGWIEQGGTSGTGSEEEFNRRLEALRSGKKHKPSSLQTKQTL